MAFHGLLLKSRDKVGCSGSPVVGNSEEKCAPVWYVVATVTTFIYVGYVNIVGGCWC